MNKTLPPNWSWVKLGDVAISEKGKKPKQLQQSNDEKFSIPYVDIKAFEKRGIDNYTDGENCRFCDPEDVLIVWDGARCGLVGRGIKGAIGSTLARIRSEKHISSFLFYFLQQHYKLINSNPKGVGIPHIEPNLFWGLNFPLPPLPEQKKIVEKIEELFSGLDSGVASLKKAKEQIRLYRQSVLSAAFSGKLAKEEKRETKEELEAHLNGVQGASNKKVEHLNGIQEVTEQEMLEHLPYKQVVPKAAEPKVGYGKDLPEGWKWVKLGEVIDSMQYGTSDKAIGNEIGIPVLRMGNIQDGKLDFTSLKYFDKSFTDLNKYLLDDGDVLFNRTNSAELVGKSAIYKKYHPKSIFASYLIRVKVTQNIYSPDFLNYYINSSYGRDFIKSVVSQNVGQANVNGTKLKGMLIPLCSLNQQIQIVEEIEKRFSEADNLEKAIDESLEKSETLRQSILKQAFEGKLV